MYQRFQKDRLKALQLLMVDCFVMVILEEAVKSKVRTK